MKNFVLFCSFVLLAIFIYFFEEIGTQKQIAGEASRSTLISAEELGELKSFETPNVVIKIEQGQYKLVDGDRDYPADRKKIHKIFKLLGNIRGKRVLSVDLKKSKNRKEFFPDENQKFIFNFKNDKIIFILGKKLNFDQSFYLEVQQGKVIKYLVAHDIGANEGIYQEKDFHRNANKYLRLKSILFLKADFFYDKKVFNQIRLNEKMGALKSIQFENFRNRPFQVSFDEHRTLPAAFSGVSYDLDSFANNKLWLNNFTGESLIFPYDRAKLKKLLSTLTITHEKKQATLKMYGLYGDQQGYFVTSSLEDYLFTVNENFARPFFYNVQDFWNKTALHKEKFSGLDNENFMMTFQAKPVDQYFSLRVAKNSQFVIELLKKNGKSPIHASFKELFAFLNLKADRISSERETKVVDFKSLYQLNLSDNIWDVLYKNGVLLLKNQKEKFFLHYNVGYDIPIGTEMKDFFE